MALLDLPAGPLSRIVSFLPLGAEAALARTCKLALARCEGRIALLKRVASRSTEDERRDIIAFFSQSTGGLRKRWSPNGPLADRVKRSRWLPTKPPAPEDTICRMLICRKPAVAVIRGVPGCAEHAVDEFCESCGAEGDPSRQGHCGYCIAVLCPRCALVTAPDCYCKHCSERITIRKLFG